VHRRPGVGDRDVLWDHRTPHACITMVVTRRNSIRTLVRVLQDERITVWYTAPTAIRMLMRAGAELARGYDLSSLRFIASVGEPLNPEAVVWGQEAFGMPIHDNWWQTETGGIMIANFRAMDVRPGSMGRPIPGVEAGSFVLATTARSPPLTTPRLRGSSRCVPAGPPCFAAISGKRSGIRGASPAAGTDGRPRPPGRRWLSLVCGAHGRRDQVVRAPDRSLRGREHAHGTPAVAEAGVIGKPSPVAGEIVKAFVALKPGFEASDALERDLLAFSRKHSGPWSRRRRLPLSQDYTNAERQDHAPLAEGS